MTTLLEYINSCLTTQELLICFFNKFIIFEQSCSNNVDSTTYNETVIE